MQVAKNLLSSIYTLYLFTKSDTPLVVFPMVRQIHDVSEHYLDCLQLTVAMVLAGPTDMMSFILAFLWLELHLLAFDASPCPTDFNVRSLTYFCRLRIRSVLISLYNNGHWNRSTASWCSRGQALQA